MKKQFYSLFCLFLLLLPSCFQKTGLDILIEQEFVELQMATLASKKTFAYQKTLNGLPTKDSIIVNFVARPRNSPVNVSYTINPISRNVTGDTIKAIEGVHYRMAPTGTQSVPSGGSFAKLPIEIMDDVLVIGKLYIFDIAISNADVPVSKYYGRSDFIFSSVCPFNINLFKDDYKCLEPGYDPNDPANGPSPNGLPDGTYKVKFTNINNTTIEIDNFWDSGIVARYVFAGNTVSLQATSTSTWNITPNGAGTFDPCSGQMTVPYTIRRVSNGSLVENNVHTFTKR